MSDHAPSSNLVVIGAGMVCMTVAARAADRGARVVIVEKAPSIGGSALLSGGILWTSSSDERMQLYGDEAGCWATSFDASTLYRDRRSARGRRAPVRN
jgi:glycine/D-amino acid oxidase-like deaminating enzyme